MNKNAVTFAILVAAAIAGGVWGYMVPRDRAPKIVVHGSEGVELAQGRSEGIPALFYENKNASGITSASKGAVVSSLYASTLSVKDLIAAYEKDFQTLGWAMEKRDPENPSLIAKNPKSSESITVIVTSDQSGASTVSLKYEK